MTIAVDFDGVVHRYSRGWHDGTIYDPPMPGALDGLRQLMEHDAVFIFTTRDISQVGIWLMGHGFGVRLGHDGPFWNDRSQLLVTNRKLAATAYLDDRAVPFTTWAKALADLTQSSAPAATEATEPDTCRLVDVGGQTLRVRGAGDMSEESRAALAEVAQAAARKHAEDQATIVQRVVDLQRAWRKAGPPSIGTSLSRWWDERLAELRQALTHPPGYASRPDDTAEEAKDRWAHQLVAVLADLDRCEHGRHEGDACGSCGSTSLGNPHVNPDRVIGYSRLAAPIFLPARDHKHEPAAWRQNPTAKDNT